MCNNNNSNECRCINEILSVICMLQQNADCNDKCLDTCDRGFLGYSIASANFNTRPVMLYTCNGNGTALSMPTSKDPNSTTTSNVFRAEKVDGCCCTFRVLSENTDATDTNPYVATNSFFTMNLNCVCALRCLDDTFVCL